MPEMWAHQKEELSRIESMDGFLCAAEMGCGKSRPVVEYVKKHKPSKVLIAVPLSAIGVWRGEFAKYAPEFLPFILTLDARESVESRWRKALQWIREKPCAIVVTNYECVRAEPFASLSMEIMWDLIVADECVEMGTPILTPEGYRPIEMLIEGDEVIGEHNGQFIRTKVTHAFRGHNDLERYEILGVRYTSNHPIWTTRGYIPTSELKPLDIVKVIGCSGLKEKANGTKMLMVQEVIRRGYYLKKVLLKELCFTSSALSAAHKEKDEGSHVGRKENGSSFYSWVETHAQKELPDNAGFGQNGTGSNIVCNIETGTGNYIANGLLVHNSHKIKSHSSVVSKHFGKLNRQSKKRVCLTGTPMSHSPLDVFGQFRFLNPAIFGYSFHQFKMRYSILGGYKQKEVVAYKNMDELHRKFYSISQRVLKDDVLDLPEEVDENIEVILSPKTLKHYKELEKNFITEIESGVVTASNALVKLLRLQQLTGGHLGYGTEGEVEEIGDEKLNALSEVIEGIGDNPVVVFARFTSEIDAIQKRFGDMEISSCRIDGHKKELDIFVSGAAQAVVVQIASGGVGIDLTRAAYAIYFSTGFSLADYLQSRARIHRPGQTRKVTYIHMLAKDTVDEDIADALVKKKNVIDHVLEGMRKGAR